MPIAAKPDTATASDHGRPIRPDAGPRARLWWIRRNRGEAGAARQRSSTPRTASAAATRLSPTAVNCAPWRPAAGTSAKSVEQRARRGPDGIGAVETRDPHVAGGEVEPHEMPDEERQRAAHHEGDRRQQDDRDGRPHAVGGCRQLVPAVGPIVYCDDSAPRSRPGAAGAATARRRVPAITTSSQHVGAQQRARGSSFTRRSAQRAGRVGAGAETEHEDGHDQRRGMNRVAEDVAELAHPDDLVDQAADAGEEEGGVEKGSHGHRVRLRAQDSGLRAQARSPSCRELLR